MKKKAKTKPSKAKIYKDDGLCPKCGYDYVDENEDSPKKHCSDCGFKWTIGKKEKSNWEIDAIQFPRLLAEIAAIGLTPQQYDCLAESMGVSRDQILELFERATKTWEQIKSNPYL